ncbi:hypothetical protein C0991_003278 [Blastosporella zonata]|nr:hypothetical protein C0991_003278 [Blastosporella zonata]
MLSFRLTDLSEGDFLVNHYKQALGLLNGQEALEKQMSDQGVAGTETFEQWLKEEREYLDGLSREPMQEMLQMEYYQKLVNLAASQRALDAASAAWLIITPEMQGKRNYTMSKETERHHAIENHKKDLKIVQALEAKLGIAMNISQMGYKLRKHIGNALKVRSQAVRTALEKYNAAAKALIPPRPQLSWDLVVEYAFLADFDLLSDTREDIHERPWAKPAARVLMD